MWWTPSARWWCDTMVGSYPLDKQPEITIKLFCCDEPAFQWSYKIDEQKIEKEINQHLNEVDFRTVQEAQIIIYPHSGFNVTQSHGDQTWFQSGSHVPITQGVGYLELSRLRPQHGLSEWFEEARRSLDIICRNLGARVGRTTSVTLDFIVHAPADAAALLRCLIYVRHVRRLQIGFDGCFAHPPNRGLEDDSMPRGGQKVLRQHVATALREHLEASSPFPAYTDLGFAFLKLPVELQATILSFIVTDPAAVMLRTEPNFHRLHAKQCCGRCRGFNISSDYECRCKTGNSVSSGCRCVSLSDPIFQVSRQVRDESLRLFWRNNTFSLHGPVNKAVVGPELRQCDRENRTNVMSQLMSIPTQHLKLIHNIIIDTDCPARSLSPRTTFRGGYLGRQNDWGSVLHHLEKYGGPLLEVEIRISNLNRNIVGSLRWQYEEPFRRDIGADTELEEERDRFVTDVRNLRLRVRAWERMETGGKRFLIDHIPT